MWQKSNLLKLKSTVNETKNLPQGSSSISEQAEQKIHKLKDRITEIIKCKKQKGKRRLKRSLKNSWDINKQTNTHLMGVSKEEKKKRQKENIRKK